jgi:Tfp pilus assembly protein PilE
MFRSKDSQRGVTVVELAIVVVMIIVLSSFGVPRLRDSLERAKLQTAMSYLAEVAAAQSAFQSAHGAYASSVEELGLETESPEGFEVGKIRPGKSKDLATSWAITATRKDAPDAFGSYTVAFNERGYSPGSCSLAEHPAIDPLVQR